MLNSRTLQSLAVSLALCSAAVVGGCGAPKAAAKTKQTTATRGYVPLNSASRIIPIGDLALIDLGEDAEVAVMLVENGRMVFDLPAAGEETGYHHIVSSDGDYAAVLYGLTISGKQRNVVDAFAIIDGRKGTVTRLGGSWTLADAEWRKLTGVPLTLRSSYRGTGGQPPVPPPQVSPQRVGSWGRADGTDGHN
ncbi:MAG TPA: hypothetical protein VFF65_10405 [Phycisphaerales bacterium]|nr:hypothetical protein [Phycisphaerales bacterium]